MAAIAELPAIVQHPTFNLRVIDQMRTRADEIIELVRSGEAGGSRWLARRPVRPVQGSQRRPTFPRTP